MLQFTIKAKDIAAKASLLSQVSSLKSVGAAVIEKCGLQITGNTLILTAINESNGIRIDNIPIEIVNGNPGDFADRTTMVELKKLVSIIKQAKDELAISMDTTGIVAQTSKAKYTLDAYLVDRDIPVNLRMSDKAIKIKTLSTLFSNANLITQNVDTVTSIAGCLISGNQLFCTDRSCALYVKNTGIESYLPKVNGDLLFAPDLFAACLPKIGAEEGFIGFTENGSKIVIAVENVTLYKSLMTGQFEKEKILKIAGGIKGITEDKGVFATVDFTELLETFNSYQSIVEQDIHMLTITREGKLFINSKNSKIGTSGVVSVGLKDLKMPETLKTFSGNFNTSSILIAEEILGRQEKTEHQLSMGIISVKGVPAPNLVAFDTDDLLFFISPKV